VTCIQTYLASTDTSALGFAPRDVESLAGQIAGPVGLGTEGIRIVPCEGASVGGVEGVQAIYYQRDDIPVGDYILYDPVWVRTVIGPVLSDKQKKARDQALFIFGHELGHILARHFTSAAGLPRIEKELAADAFAGCAAGALAASWENVEDLITRIRGDVDTSYPRRSRSLSAAKQRFDSCSRRDSGFRIVGAGPTYEPPLMNGRTLDGCLVSPDHPSGDDCSVQATQTIAARFCRAAGYLSSSTYRTDFTPAFKASYKLTKSVRADGQLDYVWNEDDSGGYFVSYVLCRN
jgi:hypothetical protein